MIIAQWLVVAFYQILCLSQIIFKVNTGYNIDEIGTAIDQYYLANYGVDRYGMQYPVYFINYGGGQNALNQYLCAIMVKLFGFNLFWLKVPGILINIVGLIYFIKLIDLTIGQKWAIISGFIYAIAPYSIMRTATILESNLAMPIAIVALYYTYKAITEQRISYWLVQGILYGIVLWAYIYYTITFGIFFIYCIIYCIKHRKINLKQQIVFTVQFLIVIQPLIMFNIVNILNLESIEIFGITIPRLPMYRGQELGNQLNIVGIIQSSIIQFLTLFYNDGATHNSTAYGVYYINTQIIFIVYIIYRLVKHKKQDNKQFKFENIIYAIGIQTIIQQLFQTANCNKISIAYISILFIVAQCLKKLDKRLLSVVIAQYIVVFIPFQLSYYNGNLMEATKRNDTMFTDFQIDDFTDCVNNIDINSVNQRVSPESIIFMQLLNGDSLQKDTYIQIKDSKNLNKRVSKLNEQIDNKESGTYMINKISSHSGMYSTKDNEKLLNKLDKLVESGKAIKTEYKYWYIYKVDFANNL